MKKQNFTEKILWKGSVNDMKTLDMYLNEQLQDEAFRKEWEENQPEMDIIRAMADARIAQNLTQKELAERTGINQADISKLENGTRNPSLKLLKRLADGMDMDLKLVFTPKQTKNVRLAKYRKSSTPASGRKRGCFCVCAHFWGKGCGISLTPVI